MNSERDLVLSDIEAYLRRYQDKELLRFVVVGSVDDGKSTFIGRLLFDTGSVYEDQIASIRKATQLKGADIDLSLLTDGLAAEREQGITIDVAYRYFSTEKRKFIIADTPGHVQYTRNMATGASTASAAIIMIDARLGVLQQSRRHAYIASLLGIRHLAVCVNKMDLVGYDRVIYARIQSEFSVFTKNLSFVDVGFFPISALDGANCVHRSPRTPWYEGPTVLEYLEVVPVYGARDFAHLRYPVQCVLRPGLDYRGFAGRVASGVVQKGDPILVLPSGKSSRVRAIDTFDGERTEAFAGQSVTLRLEDELDVSRGDMLVHPEDLPRVTRTFDAHLVWMHENALETGKTYLLKHTTQTVRAEVDRVHWRRDMDTLEEAGASTLALNDIGRVTLTAHKVLFVDPYDANREAGSFILIDSITNNTVAAGMVIDVPDEEALHRSSQVQDPPAPESIVAKPQGGRFGVSPGVLLLVGPLRTPMEALAHAVERRLFACGASGVVLRTRSEATDLDAAAAAAGAGFLAIVPAEPTILTEAAAGTRLEGRRMLVVHAHGGTPPLPPHGFMLDLGSTSVDEGADAIVLFLRENGWIG